MKREPLIPAEARPPACADLRHGSTGAPPPSEATLPKVSVVMPARNEARYIERAVTSVLTQSYPPDRLEVLVADGQSTDATPQILANIARRDARLKVIDNPDRSIPHGLNRAIRAASGSVIVRVDCHAEIRSDYVRLCVEQLQRHPVECVGGAIDSVGESTVSSAIALAMSSPFGVGNSQFRTETSSETPIPSETVPFGAFRKHVFDQIGFFREDLACHEDYEFNHRLRRSGGTILLLPWIRSRYYVRASLLRLVRQYLRYGYWKGRFMRLHPESTRMRHAIPGVLVASLLGSAVWAAFTPAYAWLAVPVPASYGLFVAIASITLARSESWRLLPWLPLAFLALHLGYGFGTLAGLIQGGLARTPIRLLHRPPE